jgi:UDP-N-acetylglucosamine acyltransferase
VTSAAQIHQTALVSPHARIAEGAVIGPYAVIEGRVDIGPWSRIGPHVVIHSYVRIGAYNQIHAHAVLGGPPQDLSFDGRETWIDIGHRNQIREGVTIHRSTNAERPTRVGSQCFVMAYAHVPHDCSIGDRVILTNNVTLGGHVEVGDDAILGGAAAVHQFVRIGTGAMVGGLSGVHKDVLPYTMVMGEPARHYRLNTVGLRRAGVEGERYHALEAAFRALRLRKPLDDIPETPETSYLRAWLEAPSKRGLARFLRSTNLQDPGADPEHV